MKTSSDVRRFSYYGDTDYVQEKRATCITEKKVGHVGKVWEFVLISDGAADSSDMVTF